MWEKLAEIASHIRHPVSFLAFALVISAITFSLSRRAKKTQLAWILALAILFVGLAPLIAATFLESRGVYRVRIVILGLDKQPVENAQIKSSVGGEPKKVEGGWEIDIPPQTRPADGRGILYASLKSAFLSGDTTLMLTKDYYPTATIQLVRDTSALVRGVVVDTHNRSVSGVYISIPGYSDVAISDDRGNFEIPAHAAEGQIVTVRAEKNQFIVTVSVPAGNTPIELVLRGS